MFYFRFRADALWIIKDFLNIQYQESQTSVVPPSSANTLSLQVRNVDRSKETQDLNTAGVQPALQWNRGPDLTYIKETGASDPNSLVILIKFWSCKTHGRVFFLSQFPITTSKLYFRNTCEFLPHQGCNDKVVMQCFLLNAKIWHFSYSSLTQ